MSYSWDSAPPDDDEGGKWFKREDGTWELSSAINNWGSGYGDSSEETSFPVRNYSGIGPSVHYKNKHEVSLFMRLYARACVLAGVTAVMVGLPLLVGYGGGCGLASLVSDSKETINQAGMIAGGVCGGIGAIAEIALIRWAFRDES